MEKFLGISEIQTAESAIIRYIQRISYKTEIENLETKHSILNKSTIHALEPFCDDQDGLLKVRGRLGRATIAELV